MNLPTCTLAALLCTLASFHVASAQNTPPSPPPIAAVRPLPDIPTLMQQVMAHQRTAEAVEKDYIFRSTSRLDKLDSHGAIKKTETREYELFWLNGVNVARLLRQDGKDLSPDQQKKENERIDKEVAKAKERRDKADAQGKQTDSAGHEKIPISRMLELGAFTNPRREQIAGRDTILVDFTGDPKAKTRSPGENAIRDLAGTIWIDEQDRSIQHLEGHFINDFKIDGGLLASISKGTSFRTSNIRINDEVWLPESIEAHGHARILLFYSLDGNLQLHASDYRKFKATSTILPNLNTLPPEQPEPPSTPKPDPHSEQAP